MLPVEEQTVACRCAMFDSFAVLVTPSINRVVEFAKRIPGSECFCDIGCNTSLHLSCQLVVGSVSYCFGFAYYHVTHSLCGFCCLFV